MTKDGSRAAHTLATPATARFLICEFDKGTADEHAALLLHLGRFAPLVCAVHSGNKSLARLVFRSRPARSKGGKVFPLRRGLGADAATWTRSQFVRCPDGTRDNGKRQTVYFTNFKSMEAAL